MTQPKMEGSLLLSMQVHVIYERSLSLHIHRAEDGIAWCKIFGLRLAQVDLVSITPLQSNMGYHELNYFKTLFKMV